MINSGTENMTAEEIFAAADTQNFEKLSGLYGMLSERKKVDDLERGAKEPHDYFSAVLSLVLEKAAKNEQLETLKFFNGSQELPPKCLTLALNASAQTESTECLDYILSLNKTTKNQATKALLSACNKKNTKAAQTLILHADLSSPEALLAFKSATDNQLVDVVDKMLSEKAIRDACFYKSVFLCAAIQSKNVTLSKKILTFSDPYAGQSEALRLACRIKSDEIVEMLLPVGNAEEALKAMKDKKDNNHYERLTQSELQSDIDFLMKKLPAEAEVISAPLMSAQSVLAQKTANEKTLDPIQDTHPQFKKS